MNESKNHLDLEINVERAAKPEKHNNANTEAHRDMSSLVQQRKDLIDFLKSGGKSGITNDFGKQLFYDSKSPGDSTIQSKLATSDHHTSNHTRNHHSGDRHTSEHSTSEHSTSEHHTREHPHRAFHTAAHDIGDLSREHPTVHLAENSKIFASIGSEANLSKIADGATFKKVPLLNAPGYLVNNYLQNFLGLDVAHEQIFFSDGSSVGYGNKGIVWSDKNGYGFDRDPSANEKNSLQKRESYVPDAAASAAQYKEYNPIGGLLPGEEWLPPMHFKFDEARIKRAIQEVVATGQWQGEKGKEGSEKKEEQEEGRYAMGVFDGKFPHNCQSFSNTVMQQYFLDLAKDQGQSIQQTLSDIDRKFQKYHRV